MSESTISSPYGIWSVTTDGDVEGKTTKSLGIWEGYIDEIAFTLADKAIYSLYFAPVDIRKVDKQPVYSNVNISLPSFNNTYEDVKFAQWLFEGRNIDVTPCQLFKSVHISTEEYDENRDDKIRQEALSKLTDEEKRVLGIE